MVKDISTGSSYPSGFYVYGSTMYFLADDGITGKELWKTNGTSTGTVLVKDINPIGYSMFNLYAIGLNNEIFFTADDGVHGNEFWKSDGTSAGTVLLKDINAGAADSDPLEKNGYAVYGGKIYFSADDGNNGVELWSSDGSNAGTLLFKDIDPGGNSTPSEFIEYHGNLYFEADNGSDGSELWKTSGTANGTSMISIHSGSSSSDPGNFLVFNNTLYFNADGGEGYELWKYDVVSGINSIKEAEKIQIYPNPASDKVFVDFKEIQGVASIELFNSIGMKIVETSTECNPAILLLSDIPSGIYHLVLTNKEGISMSQKVIRE
jgi:ELWxxDGT repeat protein